MDIFFNKLFTILFSTLTFFILWGIIYVTNQLSFFIIPFIGILYIITITFIILTYKNNKDNVWLLPINFILFYIFILLGDIFFSSGFVKYALSSTLLSIYCAPFFILTIIINSIIIIHKVRRL